MRRLALLTASLAASLCGAAAPTLADNGPHVSGAGVVADNCASCHRTHTAQAPGILKQPQEALCYSCHGASATGARTDVQSGVGYPGWGRTGTPGALRGGGLSYSLIGSDAPTGQRSDYSNPDGVVPVRDSGAAVTSTHSVDSSVKTAWGSGPLSAEIDYGKSLSLRCGSCHDPHGNGNYRILRAIPRDSGATPGVAIPDASTKAYTTDNYWLVEDPGAPGLIANISAWCSTCHTRYLSDTSQTDSGDAIFTYRHRSDQTAQGSANCIQCHVAHGSNADVDEASSGAVHNPAGRDGVPAGPGSRLLRIDGLGVCQMCHGE